MREEAEQLFLKAYDEHADAIFRRCLFRVGDKDIALDLAQETFMKTWDHLRKGNVVKNYKAFLFKVANNLIIDYWRKKKSIQERDMEEGFFSNIESEHMPANEETEYSLLIGVLQSLDQHHRDVLLLRFIEGYSIREIAEATETSENNVSVRMNRAIKKLREHIHSDE